MSNVVNLEELKEIREKSPFKNLKIQDDTVLYNHTKRVKCPTCHKHIKHYCYYCYKVMDMDRSEVPFVKLPCTIDV